jgi:hypothetical protein
MSAGMSTPTGPESGRTLVPISDVFQLTIYTASDALKAGTQAWQKCRRVCV